MCSRSSLTRYDFRYFFDPGSGTCLWSANEATREKFGYAVELESLSLPSEVELKTRELVQLFDTSINWSYPSDPPRWSDAERRQFETDARQLLELLRNFLGPDMHIRDCLSKD